MSWRDKLRQASFRGVTFGVTSDDKESGRRTVVHEFPQRDDVYVEDLGQSPTRFNIQAFVVGADYMERRDALEAALSKSGPGTLIHPWYGEISVSQHAPYKVQHSAQNGGMAVFTLSFTRDGSVGADAGIGPAPSVNAQLAALSKAGAVADIAAKQCDAAFNIVGQSAYVIEEGLNSVGKAVNKIDSAIAGAIRATEDFVRDSVAKADDLLKGTTGADFRTWKAVGSQMQDYARQVRELVNNDWEALAKAWIDVAKEKIEITVAENLGSARELIRNNEHVVNVYTRYLAVSEACRAVSLARPKSRKEAKEMLESLLDAVDTVLMGVQGPDGADGADGLNEDVPGASITTELYAAILDARAAAVAVLSETAKGVSDVVIHHPVTSLPSLVMAYDLTGTIDLVNDLVQRNGVVNPCFITEESLEVMLNG